MSNGTHTPALGACFAVLVLAVLPAESNAQMAVTIAVCLKGENEKGVSGVGVHLISPRGDWYDVTGADGCVKFEIPPTKPFSITIWHQGRFVKCHRDFDGRAPFTIRLSFESMLAAKNDRLRLEELGDYLGSMRALPTLDRQVLDQLGRKELAGQIERLTTPDFWDPPQKVRAALLADLAKLKEKQPGDRP